MAAINSGGLGMLPIGSVGIFIGKSSSNLLNHSWDVNSGSFCKPLSQTDFPRESNVFYGVTGFHTVFAVNLVAPQTVRAYCQEFRFSPPASPTWPANWRPSCASVGCDGLLPWAHWFQFPRRSAYLANRRLPKVALPAPAALVIPGVCEGKPVPRLPGVWYGPAPTPRGLHPASPDREMAWSRTRLPLPSWRGRSSECRRER